MSGVKDFEEVEFLADARQSLLDMLLLANHPEHADAVKKLVCEEIKWTQEELSDFLVRAITTVAYICLQQHVYSEHGNLWCERCMPLMGGAWIVTHAFMSKAELVLIPIRQYIKKYIMR